MKVYIRDKKVEFYKYKIDGQDARGRSVTLYAKDDAEKTNLTSKVTNAIVTDITPTTNQIGKGAEWEQIQYVNKDSYNVVKAEEYINTSEDAVAQGTEVKVISQTNASNRFVFDYNESDDSLDIFFDKE